MNRIKHFIGCLILFFVACFYYFYNKIIFYFYVESTLIIEKVFVIVYCLSLLFASLYFLKYQMKKEYILLNIYTFTLANIYFVPISCYLIDMLFEEHKPKFLTAIFNFLNGPFDVLFTSAGYIGIILSSIIPLLCFFVSKIIKNHKNKRKSLS